jgi:Protein of unknown function (DUF3606)
LEGSNGEIIRSIAACSRFAVTAPTTYSDVAEQIVRDSHYHPSLESPMRRAKPLSARNKIDLADPAQIRIWTRRLGITAEDLQRVVGKVGNSIASVSKEIRLRKAAPGTPALPIQIDPTAIPAIEAVATDASLAPAGTN